MALFHLGINTKITALTDDTQEAKACKVFYDVARRHTLASFPWNFAGKFEALALVSGGDPQGYSYAYRVPSDMITARKIHNESYTLGEIDFKVVGQEIWTDQEDAILEYTFNLDIESYFDAAFITAFSHKLASDLAMPLTRKSKLQTNETTAYFGYLSLASSINAREGLDTKEKTNDFLSARE